MNTITYDGELGALPTLLSECVKNLHYDSPIGTINLGAGYDHRPDQTK